MGRLKFPKLFALLAGLLVFSSMVLAQTQQIPRGGGESSGSVSSAPPPSSGSVSVRDNTSSVGMPSSSNMPSYRSYIPSGSGNYSASGGGGGWSTAPSYSQYINERTSFYSYDNYMRSVMFFDLLRMYYGSAFGGQYFSRYYLNSEPILNRKTLYYSLQNSYSRAGQLAQAVSELNQLVAIHRQNGDGDAAAIQDPRFDTLVSRIRTLAKQVKDDEFLPYVDVRRGSGDSAVKTANLERLSFSEQTNRLSDLVSRLNNQISGMMNDTTPAVVSVDSLSQPTFESLAKEIDRVAKNLTKANPRS